MMHVGVFTYYYFPVINGVVLTISDWMRQAKNSGIPMTVFTAQVADKKTTDPDIVEYPTIRLYQRIGWTIPMLPEPVIEKEIQKRHITLFHVHHPFVINKLALHMKKKFHIPIIFTYHTRHSDYIRMYLSFIPGRFVEQWITWLVVTFMNQCNAVTVANESLKHELLEKGVRTPIFIVPPGIDTKRFSQGNRTLLRQKYNIQDSDPVLLYVGRLAKEKNIYFLLRAFTRIRKKIPRARLLLAGKGLEEEGIMAYAKRKKMADSVIIDGDFNPETIANAYAAADMFVYASKTETFGRVLVEAMAAGLPIVALNAFSISELIADGINGRKVYKQSPRVFADVVVETFANRQKAVTMGHRAQEEARNIYDNVASWKKLLDVYTTISS